MPPDEQRRPRILIVEDEPIVAWNLEEVLVDAGFAVVAIAGQVATAVTLIESGACDAAVVDANLAGKSASPVAQALVARGLPYIVLSGYSPEQLPAAFPFTHFLQKPCRQAEIVAALTALVRTPRELPDVLDSEGRTPDGTRPGSSPTLLPVG